MTTLQNLATPDPEDLATPDCTNPMLHMRSILAAGCGAGLGTAPVRSEPVGHLILITLSTTYLYLLYSLN